MDFFFVDYRDPIAGLIVLVALVFVVALSHFFYRIFANKDEKQQLENFVKKFEIDSSHKNLLRSSNFDINALLFLASVFTKSGEFEKASEIYLIALEKTKDKNQREKIFLDLARLYFKAGFLERSKESLMQCLSIRARNKEALKLLKTVFIKLKLYNEVLNILESLSELGEDSKDEINFITILNMHEKSIPNEKKNFVNLDYSDASKRFLYQYYNIYEKQELINIIDLLYFKKELVDDEKFDEFFYALGLKQPDENYDFKDKHLKMLYILKKAKFKAKLDFSYLCTSCKSHMPLFFYHCPLCYEFGKCMILYEVKSDEED